MQLALVTMLTSRMSLSRPRPAVDLLPAFSLRCQLPSIQLTRRPASSGEQLRTLQAKVRAFVTCRRQTRDRRHPPSVTRGSTSPARVPADATTPHHRAPGGRHLQANKPSSTYARSRPPTNSLPEDIVCGVARGASRYRPR